MQGTMSDEQYPTISFQGEGIRGQELSSYDSCLHPLVPRLLRDIGGSLRCSYVQASLGFSDEDFVDYQGLMALKTKCS